MNYFWLIFALIFSLLNWLSTEKSWKWVEYISKPGVILTLLLWLFSNQLLKGLMLWFSLGLVFSLAGDFLLMLPQDRFIPGLASFLLAHVFYIVGFMRSIQTIQVPILAVVIVFLAAAFRLHQRLMQGLEQRRERQLKLPVTIYAIAINLMAISAMFTLANPAWQPFHALLATCGALLFVVSDSLLAWNKFVAPLPHANLVIMLTYHLAQAGIILGAAFHFG